MGLAFRLPWQRPPPPPPVLQEDAVGLPPFTLILAFWAIPVILCLTKGSVGFGQLVPQNLFSHEDSANVHKLLGFACLLHFIVRCAFITNDMGFDSSLLTPLCAAMHAALSVSALIFHIPKIRIKEGSRIWPEFRLHSIVFALRSLACLMLVWVEDRYKTGPHYLCNVVVIFITLILADLSTNSVDPKSRSNTIRGLETTPIYKYSFSLLQFLGTTGCLVGLRRYSAQFAIVFIIQTYAFTLTLRRKNLISHRATVVIYALQLFLGATVANSEVIICGGVDALCMFVALALLAGSLRMLLGWNKYAVWAVMSAVVQHARRCTTIVTPELRYAQWPEWGWPAAAATMIAIFLSGVSLKEQRRKPSRNSSDAGATTTKAG